MKNETLFLRTFAAEVLGNYIFNPLFREQIDETADVAKNVGGDITPFDAFTIMIAQRLEDAANSWMDEVSE